MAPLRSDSSRCSLGKGRCEEVVAVHVADSRHVALGSLIGLLKKHLADRAGCVSGSFQRERERVAPVQSGNVAQSRQL